MKKFALMALVVAVAAMSANAATVTSVEVQEGLLAGYVVNDISVTVDGDWTNSKMLLNLTSGNVYYDAMAFGSILKPADGMVGMFPSLAFTTYFTGPAGAVSFAQETKSATAMDVSWFDSTTSAAGTYLIARITLSTDANGTISGGSYSTETPGISQDWDSSWHIVNGAIVPEPATLSVLGLGALALIRRRRN